MLEPGKHIMEKNVLNAIWLKFFPYWPLVLLFNAIGIASALLYLKISPPLYEASASLLIKDKSKGLEDAKIIESLNLMTSKKIVENEIEVIKSRSVVNKVVQNLGLYGSVFKDERWKAALLYDTAPVQIQVDRPERLKLHESVYFTIDPKQTTIRIRQKDYLLNHWVDTPYGKMKFVPTSTPFDAHSTYFFTLRPPKDLSKEIDKRLTVSSANKLSSVLNLQYKDEDPKRAEQIINEIISVYVQGSINQKNSLATNALTSIENRLKSTASKLDSIERRLESYKSNKTAIDISEQGKLYLENVSIADKKLREVTMNLAILGRIEAYVMSKDSSGGIVPSSVNISDPVLLNLLTNLYDTELRYEQLKKTTGKNNPVLLSLINQINKLRPSILENIISQRKTLESSKEHLLATSKAYNSLLKSIPQKERELVEVSRQQIIQNNIYTFLLQRKEEAALSYLSVLGDTHQIIDQAEGDSKPVWPKPNILLLSASIVSTILSLLLVAGKDFFKNTIVYRHEIEQAVSLPIIGEIHAIKPRQGMLSISNTNTLFAEQLRRLRSYYLNQDTRYPQKILVTSSTSGEGKSFVAVNLAISLTMAGQKVALLEFDFIKPTLSKRLMLSPSYGVSDYLMGELDRDSIIQPVSSYPNLFIISSGTIPANPSELILSTKTKILLDELEQQFDFIILDTPPIEVLSYSSYLANFCDSVLYIIRHKHSPRLIIERLEETLQKHKLKQVALVFNGVEQRGLVKTQYGYGNTYVDTYYNKHL